MLKADTPDLTVQVTVPAGKEPSIQEVARKNPRFLYIAGSVMHFLSNRMRRDMMLASTTGVWPHLTRHFIIMKNKFEVWQVGYGANQKLIVRFNSEVLQITQTKINGSVELLTPAQVKIREQLKQACDEVAYAS